MKYKVSQLTRWDIMLAVYIVVGFFALVCLAFVCERWFSDEDEGHFTLNRSRLYENIRDVLWNN